MLLRAHIETCIFHRVVVKTQQSMRCLFLGAAVRRYFRSFFSFLVENKG
jgi:hypothetical protein